MSRMGCIFHAITNFLAHALWELGKYHDKKMRTTALNEIVCCCSCSCAKSRSACHRIHSYSAGFAIASVVLTESIHAAYFVSEHGHNIHLVIGHEESVAY